MLNSHQLHIHQSIAFPEGQINLRFLRGFASHSFHISKIRLAHGGWQLWESIRAVDLGLDDLAPRIQQLRHQQEQLQSRKWELEALLSDRRVELADLKMVTRCVADLRSLLEESILTERKSFIRSFVKEVKVTGDEVLLVYTMPLPPKGISREVVGVLPIVHFGGPSDSIAQPQIKTFFELSLVPADYSTININPPK